MKLINQLQNIENVLQIFGISLLGASGVPQHRRILVCEVLRRQKLQYYLTALRSNKQSSKKFCVFIRNSHCLQEVGGKY